MKHFDTIARTARGRIIAAFVALLILVAAILTSQSRVDRSVAAVVTSAPSATAPQALAPTSPLSIPETPKKVETKPATAAAPAAETTEKRGRAIGSGRASFYGQKFAGRRTANGETFNPAQLTAAHKSLPFGSRVRVTNQNNGRSIVVRVNDRGPFVAGRVIDVSTRAAEQLGMISSGTAPVKLELIS